MKEKGLEEIGMETQKEAERGMHQDEIRYNQYLQRGGEWDVGGMQRKHTHQQSKKRMTTQSTISVASQYAGMDSKAVVAIEMAAACTVPSC